MIEVNDLIGKRFASDPDKAFGPNSFSCYGLTREVHRRAGIYLPKVNISVIACKQVSQDMIREHAMKYWQRIESPVVPCVVLIKSTNPEYADHICTYIGRGRIIHVMINRPVAVEKISGWKQKIIGYWKYVSSC
jgi:cell wall-associated NlpC family hydrolase